MAKIICSCANLKCSAGSIFAKFFASNELVKVANNAVGTNADDVKSTFGFCAIQNSECIPQLGSWENSNNKIRINGTEVLTTESSIKCTIGGVLSFADAGQGSVDVDHE